MAPFSPIEERDDEQQINTKWLTDFDRPSFGERIGAKERVAPAQPAQPAQPVQASQDSQPPAIKFDPQNVPAGIFAGTTTPRMPPEAPVGSRNPNLVGLLKQQAEYGKPLDRKAVDPNTGKPLYRMGWGQRLLGSVANFASGFGGKDQEPRVISRTTRLSKLNLRISARNAGVFPIRSVWIGERKVAPAVAAFSATHLALLFASQFGGQISVAHARVLLGSGVALGVGIQAHWFLSRTLRGQDPADFFGPNVFVVRALLISPTRRDDGDLDRC